MSCEDKAKLQIAKKRVSDILSKMDAACGPASRAIRHWRMYAEMRKLEWPKKYFVALAVFFLSYLLIRGTKSTWHNKASSPPFFHHGGIVIFAKILQCLVEYPSTVQKFFRPAEDCSVCRDLVNVEKMSNVDVEVFEKR